MGKAHNGWYLTSFWFKDKRDVLPQLMASLAETPGLRVFRCSTKHGDGRGAVALDLRGIVLNGSLMAPYLLSG